MRNTPFVVGEEVVIQALSAGNALASLLRDNINVGWTFLGNFGYIATDTTDLNALRLTVIRRSHTLTNRTERRVAPIKRVVIFGAKLGTLSLMTERMIEAFERWTYGFHPKLRFYS